MALVIPAAITAFFATYPNALDVFVLENGKAYLNHFQEKALKAAKSQSLKLYQVQSNLSNVQIYPVLPVYHLRYTNSNPVLSGNIGVGLFNNVDLGNVDPDSIASVYLVVDEGTVNITGVVPSGDIVEKWTVSNTTAVVTAGNEVLIGQLNLNGQAPGTFACNLIAQTLEEVNKDVDFSFVVPVPLYTYVGTEVVASISECKCNVSSDIPAGSTSEEIKASMLAACAAAGVTPLSVEAVIDGANCTMTIITPTTATFILGTVELLLQP